MEWAPILAFTVFLVGLGIVAGTAIKNAIKISFRQFFVPSEDL